MSRIEDLMNSCCPDGVEYKPLGECVLKAENIKWKNEEGTYKYIDLTSVDRETHRISECSTIDKTSAPSRAQQIVREGDILFGGTRPMLKRYCIVPKEYDGQICSTGFCVLRPNEDIVTSNWVYHIISSTEFYNYVEKNQKGASYPAITDKEVKLFKIPVPPIEVQREMVRILDDFSGSTSKLIKKLNAELVARKKQYDYYSRQLFENNGHPSWTELSKIADIGTGCSNTNEAVEDGAYPFFVRSQEPLRKNSYEYDETAIITAGDGVGVGKVFHFVEGKYALHQRAYRIHINTDKVIPKYCFYYIKNAFYDYISKTMFQGSVASIRRPMLNEFLVPVVPIEEQLRIIAIYDKLEKNWQGIFVELQNEIEARQKQYEYYRDKLLTFKEAV